MHSSGKTALKRLVRVQDRRFPLRPPVSLLNHHLTLWEEPLLTVLSARTCRRRTCGRGCQGDTEGFLPFPAMPLCSCLLPSSQLPRIRALALPGLPLGQKAGALPALWGKHAPFSAISLARWGGPERRDLTAYFSPYSSSFSPMALILSF